jgi:hypothetical protein
MLNRTAHALSVSVILDLQAYASSLISTLLSPY